MIGCRVTGIGDVSSCFVVLAISVNGFGMTRSRVASSVRQTLIILSAATFTSWTIFRRCVVGIISASRLAKVAKRLEVESRSEVVKRSLTRA